MKPVPYEALEAMWAAVKYQPSAEQRAVHEALLEPAYGFDVESGEYGEMPRVVVVGGGIQGGKSFSASMHAYGRAMADPLIWLVGVDYKDTKTEFDFIRDAGLAVGAVKPGDFNDSKDGPWELSYHAFGKHRVKTLNSSDVTNLAREAPDGIIMCEPGRQTKEAFETLRERVGVGDEAGWLLVSGTFEEASRWYPLLYEEGLGDNPYKVTSLSIPTYSNRKRFPRGIDDPRFRILCQTTIKEHPVDGEDRVMERFYGIPRKTRGLVFWDFSRQIHVKEEARYLPGIDVSLAVDPGYGNPFAILFIQVVQGQIRIFDELYETQTRSRDLIAMIKNHRSFPDLRHIVMDVAVKQHTNAQDSALETWQGEFGPRGITVTGQYVRVKEGIARTHDKLTVDLRTGQPRLIVSAACKMLIYEMTDGYRYHVSRTTGETGEEPIDAHDHAVKALAYWIIDRYGYNDGPRMQLPAPTVDVPAYDRIYAARRRGYAGRTR